MLQSPEVASRISHLRMKATEGTITLEEQKEAIRLLREDRRRAAESSPAKTSRKPSRSADDLLGELEGL